MSDEGSIVVVGGGHAGAQLCIGLAEAGLGARVHLVCEEDLLPYQRPPLSKAYLKNADEQLQEHRASTWFRDRAITVHHDAVTAIDRAARKVTPAGPAPCFRTRGWCWQRARAHATCTAFPRGSKTLPWSARRTTRDACAA